jgi:molybdopterin-containing oxidoreductase family iron-sulfur binding subunit
MKKKTNNNDQPKPLTRRKFLKGTAAGAATLAIPVGTSDASVWQSFFQKHFLEMSKAEMDAVIKRMEKEYADKYKTSFNIKTTSARPDTLFGYGLDLSRCIGCRRCVYACVRENNQSRDPQIHYISVLQFEKGEKWVSDLEESDKYYYPEKVPEAGHFYMPVQCQQCENPLTTTGASAAATAWLPAHTAPGALTGENRRSPRKR